MNTPDEAEPACRLERARVHYRRHRNAFLVVNGALHVINVYMGAPWWAFWPLFAWGVVFLAHFLYVRTITVDEAWVDERAEELRYKSYDLGHIRDIEERVEKRDSSVRPGDERDEQ